MLRRRHLLCLLLVAFVVGIVLVAADAAPLMAQGGCDRFVLGIDTSDSTDCSDEAHPCRTIQYAIDQAAPGDVICVASHILAPKPLVYPETLTITKTVTLDGAWEGMCVNPNDLVCNFDPIPCVPTNIEVDAGGAGRTVTIDGSAAPGTVAPVIDCLTITGGDAEGLGGDPGGMDAGGGVYSVDAAPIIANSVITANFGCNACSTTYGRGGGIYLLNAPITATIRDSIIANNVADGSTWGVGGGILLQDSDAQVRDNVIRYNRAGSSAGDGGGIAVRGGSPKIAGNDILHNFGARTVQGFGGGIYVWSTTPTTVTGNTIRYNQAITGTGDPALRSMGGGIYYAGNPSVAAVIRDNDIAYNLASPLVPQTGLGGGIYLRGLAPGSVVSGNAITWNIAGHNDDGNGGGIYAEGSEVTIADNVLESNAATWSGGHGMGGGIYVDGGAVLIATNVITGNAGGYFPGLPSTATGVGGGIAASGADVIVRGNDIVNNDGTNGDNWGWGGGIYAEGGTTQVLTNTISGNTGGLGQSCFGGGVAMTGTVGTVRGNTVENNTATLADWGTGGGVFADLGTYLIAGNVISGNTSSPVDRGYGGGVTLQFNTATVEGNTILDNVASPGPNSWGGGVRIAATDAFTLTNNIIARNAASTLGSGVAILGSDGVLVHNTIVENLANDDTGVAVQISGTVVLTNNLIAWQKVGIYNTGSPVAVVSAEQTLFDSVSVPVMYVLNLTPLGGPAALLSNYHLGPGSNAIDQGVSVPWVTVDIDLDARPRGKGPDVGADEFSCLARTGLIDYSVVQDAIDAAGALAKVKVAEGTCYENLSIAKTITLEGGYPAGDWDEDHRYAAPAAHTTIDGLGAGRVISITEPPSSSIAPVIDGLTLTGGDATGLRGGSGVEDVGGGIYGQDADITVQDCAIVGNVASRKGTGWGGGIGTYQCNVILKSNLIASNTAALIGEGSGGGVALRIAKRVVELSSNRIEDNVATGDSRSLGYGGGIWLYNAAGSFNGNLVRANTANTSGEGRGGGIYAYLATSLEMDGDVVEDNVASGASLGYGGGIGVVRSGLDLTGAQLLGNQANSFGGGLYVEDGSRSRIQDTDLVSNTAGIGGGFYLTGSSGALIADSRIHGNSAGYGGGGASFASPSVTVRDNLIYGNSVEGRAGGLWLDGSSGVQLMRNWITANHAAEAGGVLLMSDTDTRLVNNVIADNIIQATGDGAGVLVEGGSAQLLHSTLARNVGGDGSGIHVTSGASVWMTNTIAVSHTVAITVATGSSASFASNLWGSGAWANGTDWDGSGILVPAGPHVYGDPGFVVFGAGSYHIGPGSAAIDAGIAAGILDDVDGHLRPLRFGFDIGADEALYVCLPLVMRD